MTKVYIVSSGCYSDYAIDRVFLDRENAEKYIKLTDNHWDSCRIEEYDTDDNKEFTEIVYIDGEYIKGSQSSSDKDRIEVKIKRTNTLDDTEENVKQNYFYQSDYFGKQIIIRRVINNNNFDEEKIIKKYKKVLYDLMVQIEYLMSTGWNKNMIQKWLGQNADNYTNK